MKNKINIKIEFQNSTLLLAQDFISFFRFEVKSFQKKKINCDFWNGSKIN